MFTKVKMSKKYVRQEKSQRKHPVASSASSLITAPVVPTVPKERPGWKGPGFIKKTPKQAQQSGQSNSARATSIIQEQRLPIPLQQLLLNVLQKAVPACRDYEILKPMLQEIRLALSNGASDGAFSRPDWMDAYVVRWSSIRALSCATVLAAMFDLVAEDVWVQNLLKDRRTIESPSRATCFGGGPTELMAFAAVLRHIRPPLTDLKSPGIVQPQTDDGSSAVPEVAAPIMKLHLVDKANWTPSVLCLETGLLSPPVLSKYASQSAKLNNISFIPPGDLSTSLLQTDILGASQDELAAIIGSTPSLITFFFTLDDLHTTSTAKTAALLLKLTLVAPKDSLLLVVDSPEPPPNAAAGVEEAENKKRRYRMGKWLDLVLMDKFVFADAPGKPAWKYLLRDEDRLFKLGEGLKFPISLDHVRFQIHLFKKQ
ncbi:hypothetical protein BKA65DRAFT_488597 [Rhexocercosporidium sp. MPI-PUGE-AT-0058]|nr:hypothetical protein BKA65DRAFT_488597 [Rhexocercosporidium sp. MPI-PUGE-AT-0058]